METTIMLFTRRTSVCLITLGATFVARILISLGVVALPKPTPTQVLPASTSVLLEGLRGHLGQVGISRNNRAIYNSSYKGLGVWHVGSL